MKPTGYQAYRQQTLNTMTQGELLLVVYDELLKRLTAAEYALSGAQNELFDKSIQRSEEIVQYLMSTLNFQYEISNQLQEMYQFFLYYLSRIRAGKDAKKIGDVKRLVKELRDAYAEAQRMTNQ